MRIYPLEVVEEFSRAYRKQGNWKSRRRGRPGCRGEMPGHGRVLRGCIKVMHGACMQALARRKGCNLQRLDSRLEEILCFVYEVAA